MKVIDMRRKYSECIYGYMKAIKKEFYIRNKLPPGAALLCRLEIKWLIPQVRTIIGIYTKGYLKGKSSK